MKIRIVGILIIFISNVGFGQTDAVIACPPYKVRKIDEAYRISSTPEKLSLTELASTVKDSTASTKQKENMLIVSLPNTNMLYPGYSNLIQLGFTDTNIEQYTLECDGCDTLFEAKNSSENTWILRANNTDKITLRALSNQGEVIGTSEIPVFPLPSPTVYLDGLDAQTVLKTLPNQIRLKYNESIPLSAKFYIKRWGIHVNSGDVFTGFGTAITQTVKDLIQAEKYGTISIWILFEGPCGKQEQKEIFEFALD